MEQYKKKEIAAFLGILTIVAITFVGGLLYIRSNKVGSNSGVVSDTSSNTTNATSDLTQNAQLALSTTTITDVVPESPSSTTPSTTKIKTPAPATAVTTTAPVITSAPPIPPPVPNIVLPTTATASVAVALPYSIGTFANQFSDNDGWSQWMWGTVSQNNGELTIESNATSTSGGDLLVGSKDWNDYTFQTILDWYSGQTFGLMARYVDDKNYLECEFGEQNIGTLQVNFEQFINGTETTLASGNINNYNQIGGADISAAIQVNGDQGSCGFNYNSISTYVAGNSIQPPFTGGIGIVVWDPTINNSKIIVKSLGVSTSSYYLGPNTIQGN
jgi:hypothetical protein